MLVLAIDTATRSCGVALVEGDSLLGEYVEGAHLSHSSRLMPMVHTLLSVSGRDKRELDGLAVTIGPGSYTGLRIGLATAKVMAAVLGIPVAAVNTLEALAFSAGIPDYPVCPMIDARRGRVYTGLYDCAASGTDLDMVRLPRPVRPPTVADVRAWLNSLPAGRILFIGDGALAYRGNICSLMPGRGVIVPAGLSMARPAAVALLGAVRLRQGDVVAPQSLAPLYLTDLQHGGERGPSVQPDE